MMRVHCSVCGGPGEGTIRAAAAQWTGTCRHSDPAVCHAYLRQRERDLAAREAALRKAEA